MHTRLQHALAAHCCTDADTATVSSTAAAVQLPAVQTPHAVSELANDHQTPVQQLLSGGPVHSIAPQLLGALLHHNDVVVRLTEVEAYGGESDPGSHAARGKTARNAVMFGPAGHLYVYLIYGMHCCANIVVGPAGSAGAVLVRAGEVVHGLEVARARRPKARDHELARGPACLCKVLGIDRSHDGADIIARSLAVSPAVDAQECASHGGHSEQRRRTAARAGRAGPWLELPARDSCKHRAGPRVGLRHAASWPWRFWLPDEPSVSVYRPAAPLKRSRRSNEQCA